MKSFVMLRISGNDLELNIISKQLGIIPEYAYKKGDPIISKQNNKIVGKYNEDCWIYGMESHCNETTEMCLERFLEKILPNSAYLKTISVIYNITIWISVYSDDEQNNFHVSKNSLKTIYEMGATLDISTSFLKEFYE